MKKLLFVIGVVISLNLSVGDEPLPPQPSAHAGENAGETSSSTQPQQARSVRPTTATTEKPWPKIKTQIIALLKEKNPTPNYAPTKGEIITIFGAGSALNEAAHSFFSPEIENTLPKLDSDQELINLGLSPEEIALYNNLKPGMVQNAVNEIGKSPESLLRGLLSLVTQKTLQGVQADKTLTAENTIQKLNAKFSEVLSSALPKFPESHKEGARDLLVLMLANQEPSADKFNPLPIVYAALGGTKEDFSKRLEKLNRQMAAEEQASAGTKPDGKEDGKEDGSTHSTSSQPSGVAQTRPSPKTPSTQPAETQSQTNPEINPAVASQLALVAAFKKEQGRLSPEALKQLRIAMYGDKETQIEGDKVFQTVHAHLKDRPEKMYGMVLKLKSNDPFSQEGLQTASRIITAMSSSERNKFSNEMKSLKAQSEEDAYALIGLKIASIVEAEMRGKATPINAESIQQMTEKVKSGMAELAQSAGIPGLKAIPDDQLKKASEIAMKIRQAETKRVADYNSILESCRNRIAAACDSIRTEYGQDVFQYHAGQARLTGGEKQKEHLNSFTSLSGMKDAKGTASLWVVRKGEVINHHIDASDEKLVKAYANDIADNGGVYDFKQNKAAEKYLKIFEKNQYKEAQIREELGQDKDGIDAMKAARIAKLEGDKIAWTKIVGSDKPSTSSNEEDGSAPPNDSTTAIGNEGPQPGAPTAESPIGTSSTPVILPATVPADNNAPVPTSNLSLTVGSAEPILRQEIAKNEIELIQAEETLKASETTDTEKEAARKQITQIRADIEEKKTKTTPTPETIKHPGLMRSETAIKTLESDRKIAGPKSPEYARLSAQIINAKDRADGFRRLDQMKDGDEKAKLEQILDLQEQIYSKELELVTARYASKTEVSEEKKPGKEAEVAIIFKAIGDLREKLEILKPPTSEYIGKGDPIIDRMENRRRALEIEFRLEEAELTSIRDTLLGASVKKEDKPALLKKEAQLRDSIHKKKKEVTDIRSRMRVYNNAQSTSKPAVESK